VAVLPSVASLDQVWAAGFVCLGVASCDYFRTAPAPAQWCMLAVNLVAGLLMVVRRDPPDEDLRAAGRGWGWALALVFNGMLFRLTQPVKLWPRGATLLFIAGTGATTFALLSLGRSFGIRPSLRTVSTRGAYRLVRHPAYLGECGMAAGCLLGRPGWWALLAFVLLVAFQVRRIGEEEKLLRASAQYAEYVRRVRWRLLPFIW
jgi:protein-S-isoprenylcysteine O-methyltransferase Ste14